MTSTAPRTLYAVVGGVQVSFFGYGYPTLLAPDEPAPGLLPLASIPDIAAMKLAAIASRGSRKDFVDLWFLLEDHMSLGQALDAFRQKYEMADLGHVVRALVYFDDADSEPELRIGATRPVARRQGLSATRRRESPGVAHRWNRTRRTAGMRRTDAGLTAEVVPSGLPNTRPRPRPLALAYPRRTRGSPP